MQIVSAKLLCRFQAVSHSRVPAASLCFPTPAQIKHSIDRPACVSAVIVLAEKSKSSCLISEVLKRGLECVLALEVFWFILAVWLQKLQSGVFWMWICSFFTTSTRFVLDVRAAGRCCVPSPTSHREPLLGRNVIFSLPRFPGRAPETKVLGLDKLGVQLNQETGKIVVGADESTSVPNIYAFGDIGEVRWRERTPLTGSRDRITSSQNDLFH